MKKSIIVSTLVLFALAYACTKDTETAAPIPQEQLVGKWHLTSANWNSHYNGIDNKDSAKFSKGELSYEFTKDGRVISLSPYYKDTLTYKLLDGRLIVLDSHDTIKISVLANASMQWHIMNIKSEAGDFFEETDNFSK
jgi:hypothetical protein